MGGITSGDDDVIADINITPFVDIILVVLIIFMVTASQIVESSIKVNLPEASTGEATETTSLGVTLLSTNKMMLDGVEVDPPQLKAALLAAKAEAGDDVVVLIAADEMVAHGRVVWLMDFVRAHGVSKFAINIDKASAIPPDPASVAKGTAE